MLLRVGKALKVVVAHVITLVRVQRDTVQDLGPRVHAQDPVVHSIGIMLRKTIINVVHPAGQPVLIQKIVNMKVLVSYHQGEVPLSDQRSGLSTGDSIPLVEV